MHINGLLYILIYKRGKGQINLVYSLILNLILEVLQKDAFFKLFKRQSKLGLINSTKI